MRLPSSAVRLLATASLAAATVVVAPRASAQTPAGPGTTFRTCARTGTEFGQMRICSQQSMLRTVFGNGNGDTAEWGGWATLAYRRVWEGFAFLDTSNHAIRIDETAMSDDNYDTWFDSDKVVSRCSTNPNYGQAFINRLAFSDCVEHFDIVVSGPTTLTQTSPPVNTQSLAYITSCVTPYLTSTAGAFTEVGTLQHELGHVYGYDHFDGWVTGMNTSQIDTSSCELGTSSGGLRPLSVTPDAYLTQCHDIVYGVGAPTDLDISITPVIQKNGCILASGGCATIDGAGPNSPVDVGSGLTTFTRTFRYTTLMNRGGIGAAGVFVGTYLSRNRTVDSADVKIDEYFSDVDWQPGSTIRKVRTVTFNPQIAMPFLDSTYYVLVKVDHDSYFTETRESNNVTDLGISFRRR